MKTNFPNQPADREDADLAYLFALDHQPDLEMAATIQDTLTALKAQSGQLTGSTAGAADSSQPLNIPTELYSKTRPARPRPTANFYPKLALVATLVITVLGLSLLVLLAATTPGQPPVSATVPAATAKPTPAPSPRVTNQVSFDFEGDSFKDWLLWNGPAVYYGIRQDNAVSHSGQSSALLAPTSPNPLSFGAIARQYDLKNYLGKRVRLRGFIKTEGIDSWAGLLMRVDGPNNTVLNFDNMQNRPVIGTTDWQEYSIVLDVPPESTILFIGAMMQGRGQVWLDDLTLEAISLDAPVTTGYLTMPIVQTRPLNLDFETDFTNNAWFVSGNHPEEYNLSRDTQVKQSGQASASFKFIAPGSPTGFGVLMQTFAADPYHGRRIRLSGYLKTEQVEGWAGLWLRIDGQKYKVEGFDNMENRPVKGTTGWQKYEIVLDVPPDSVSLNLGVQLTGQGAVWLDNLHIEVVDQTVPTTNLLN